MKRIRKLLLSTLGERRYLWILASSFQKLYRTGRLGVDYQDLYFLKALVRKDDYVIDIGAHLGYYTMELSRLVGNNGKVFAIEPISKFNQTLQTLLRRKKVNNTSLYQLALGGNSPFVEMGIPRVDNVKKFAYARIKDSNPDLQYEETEKIKNETGDNLFSELPRMDFIKCDVEGVEIAVFRSFLHCVDKFKPVILCELGDKNERIRMFDLLSPFKYQAFYLQNKKLHPLDVHSDIKTVSHNHYFLPIQKIALFQQAIN
jgi:FkbM family methyltransferase